MDERHRPARQKSSASCTFLSLCCGGGKPKDTSTTSHSTPLLARPARQHTPGLSGRNGVNKDGRQTTQQRTAHPKRGAAGPDRTNAVAQHRQQQYRAPRTAQMMDTRPSGGNTYAFSAAAMPPPSYNPKRAQRRGGGGPGKLRVNTTVSTPPHRGSRRAVRAVSDDYMPVSPLAPDESCGPTLHVSPL